MALRSAIHNDGTIFTTTQSGAGGDEGFVTKINQAVNLLARPDSMPPDQLARFSYSHDTVRTTFANHALTSTSDVKYVQKSDNATCVIHTSSAVAFSPDFTSCWVKAWVTIHTCGPPDNGRYRIDLVRSLSCAIRPN
jgi:hypothetical protein